MMTLTACGGSSAAETYSLESSTAQAVQDQEQEQAVQEDAAVDIITIQVGDQTFTATLNNSNAAREFAGRLPLTLSMSELHGNEKYFYLDKSLPASSEPVGSIQNGDLMLYGSDCLVLFYKSFSTPYSYTRLGRIDDPAGLEEAVGRGGVEIVFRLEP